MGIDFARAEVHAEDPANKDILGRSEHESINLMLYQTSYLAQKQAERIVRHRSVPLDEIEAKCNRFAFKHQVGDLLKVSSTKYGFTDKVCRVMHIRDDDINSDNIIVHLAEDGDYKTTEAVQPPQQRYGGRFDPAIDTLAHIYVMEAPYALVSEDIFIIPLVAREKGTEIGFLVYLSTDGGTSYQQISIEPTYAVHGTLVEALSKDQVALHTDTYMTVDFSLPQEAGGIETIGRHLLISGENIGVLVATGQEEIIGIERIVPDDTVAGRYRLEGLSRGKLDTPKRDWAIGDEYYFMGRNFPLISDPNLFKGSTRYFKFVPYNDKFAGELDLALAKVKVIEGRGRSPYRPGNLRANTVGRYPEYSTTIDLTWSPRIRGGDAGINDPDQVTDAAPTWEGLFKIEVWVASVLEDTISDINDDAYSFTQVAIEAWTGSLPDEITFRLFNTIVTNSVTYESVYNEIIVEKV